MALSANTVVEVRTAGDDTNGGGFVAGATGSDYSQTDTKRTATGADDSTTDAVANGTTTITSATAVFGTTIVGNIIYLAGGSGGLAAGWYQVATRTNATTITVDRTVAAGTGITMNIGGALASPGKAGSCGLVAGGQIWIKSGTYSITSSTGVSGGVLIPGVQVFVQGYQTTRGDLGTAPLLQASGISNFALIAVPSADSAVVNINVDGAGLTNGIGISARGSAFMCGAANCTTFGFEGNTNLLVSRCWASGCSGTAAFSVTTAFDCIAFDCTITGFTTIAASSTFVRCIADTCTGASSDGFVLGSDQCAAINCVAYGCGRDGFRVTSGDACYFENNIAEGNTGFGYLVNNRVAVRLQTNAVYDNDGGTVSLGTGKACFNNGLITGTGSFFTNAAGQDFSLNNTASAGAAVRAVGFPGALAVGGTGYLDLGALQHQDSGSAGGGIRLAGRGGLASGA